MNFRKFLILLILKDHYVDEIVRYLPENSKKKLSIVFDFIFHATIAILCIEIFEISRGFSEKQISQ